MTLKSVTIYNLAGDEIRAVIEGVKVTIYRSGKWSGVGTLKHLGRKGMVIDYCDAQLGDSEVENEYLFEQLGHSIQHLYENKTND